jgi:flagellar motility protein MotE (MotC chaperone)
MADKPGLWSYIKAAFNVRWPVPGLGGVPVNWLAVLGFAIAGFLVHPAIWLLGAGLEFGFVMMLAQNPRFQRLVDANQGVKEDFNFAARVSQMLAGVPGLARKRYADLELRCAEIRKMTEALAPGAMSEIQVGGLKKLLWIFLRLLVSRETILSTARTTNREDIQDEIRRSEEQLAQLSDPAKERLRKSVEANLELLKKRLANVEESRHALEFIEAELKRIENQVELIAQEAAMAKDGGYLSTKIDTIAGTLSETQDWMKSNRDILGGLEDLEMPPGVRV